MTSGIGPEDATYNDALLRVAKIMEASRKDLADIKEVSDESFRLWLDRVIQRVSSAMGIGLAKAQAFVADVMTTIGNAGTSFVDSYRRAYSDSRQIKPRRRNV